MKSLPNIFIAFAIVSILASCYKKDPYWLDENIEDGGTYYPQLQAFEVTPVDDSVFRAGIDVELRAQFWSRDDIQSIEFYELIDTVEIAIQDFQENFDEESESFFQTVTTTLPETPGDSVEYQAVIRTVHDLTKEASVRIYTE